MSQKYSATETVLLGTASFALLLSLALGAALLLG